MTSKRASMLLLAAIFFSASRLEALEMPMPTEERLEVRTYRHGIDVFYVSKNNVKLHAEVRSVPFESSTSFANQIAHFDAKVEDHRGNRLFTGLSSRREPVAWAAQTPQPDFVPPAQSFEAAQEMSQKIANTRAPLGQEGTWAFLSHTVLASFDNYASGLERVRSQKQQPASPLALSNFEVEHLAQLEQPTNPYSSGSGGRLKMPEEDRAEAPGYLFKQVIELWSQPWTMKTMHSATYTITYVRQKCAPGDTSISCQWNQLLVTSSGNHGAHPGQENMQRYQVCDPGVEIDGWYQVNNECEGFWGIEHSCNDDTASQINNAFGVWTGHHCLGKRREVRPWCQRHWG